MNEREMLEQVAVGEWFSQEGKDANFNSVLAMAQDLNRKGFFIEPYFHWLKTGEERIDLLKLATLSLAGERRLAQLRDSAR